MNKLIVFFIISMQFLVCFQLEAQDKNEPEKTTNKRFVNENILVSEAIPEIEIAVSEEFGYVGRFDFEIIANSDEYPKDLQGKPVAAGERFVFASVDQDRNINKLFILQFEGFLAENDFIYNYNFDNAETIGDNKYRYNTWFYDSKKLAEENPSNEGAKTRAFLMEKGYQLEDQYMMGRFVGLASEDRKNELIIYYIEMLEKTTGYSLEEYENSLGKEEAASIRNAFVERSRDSFKIIKG